MRFLTAPELREYAQNERFRERLGAVTNRTIGVNLVRLIHLSPPRGFGKSHLSTSGAIGI